MVRPDGRGDGSWVGVYSAVSAARGVVRSLTSATICVREHMPVLMSAQLKRKNLYCVVRVRVCECASVRVCECASVRVCECASVRVCECARVCVLCDG